ncbi:MAG TPA: endonuclease/exonuclease/phosphatase family protein [Polyangiaceae bacterium]|nr:endonuclease/exonuclease/phosphatase family protein [Polyangiaceae bacterium]
MFARILFSGAVFLVACGPAPLRPRDPTPGVVHFKIETFNVYQDAYDDPATVEAIGAADADLVCLQEIQAPWEDAIRARYAEQYPNMLFRSAPGSDGLAVISKFPLEDQGFHESPIGQHPDWHVVADTPMGPVQLLNIHLRSVFRGEPSKIDSYFDLSRDHLEEIQTFSAECIPGMPTIAAGDYNEEPTGSAVKYLEGKNYRNALPMFHPGQGTWRDPPAWQFEQTIDHILFDEAFDPLNAWVELRGNSDHLPVVAHLQAAPP